MSLTVSSKTDNGPDVEIGKPAKGKTSLFLYLVSFYIFLDIGRIPELFPILATIQLQKIIGGIAVLSLFLAGSAQSNLRQRMRTPQVKCILGLLIWSVLSIPFGVWPGNSLNFMINAYWKIILTFFLILSSINSIHDLGKIKWAFLIAIGFLAFFAVIGVQQERMSASTTYDPNDITVYMATALPLIVFGFVSQKGFKKIVSGILAILVLMTIIGATSRGGFLAFLAVSIFILIWARKIERKIFLPLMVIFAIGIGVFLVYAGSQYWDRMNTLLHLEEDYNLTAPGGRMDVWKRGLSMVAGNPFTGVGISNFTTAEGISHLDTGGKWSTAHNSFIQIGAELGIPGLILFCYAIWISIRGITQTIKRMNQGEADRNMLATLVGLKCAWIGYVVGGFFVSAAYSSLFVFLVGLSTAISCFGREHKEKNLQHGLILRSQKCKNGGSLENLDKGFKILEK